MIKTPRAPLALPQISLAERDRRWTAVRGVMRERKLDALFLCGWPLMWDFKVANARFLSTIGGNAEFNLMVFPLEGEPTSFVSMPTFLEGWKRAQNWVSDVRPRKGSWADSIAGRITELGLERGRIGLDGLAGPLDPDGWLPHSVYVRLKELLPHCELVNIEDMLEAMRGVKSDEELGILERAAVLGDRMMAACRDNARVGVTESAVYASMIETMIANGGEEPTLFLWAAGAMPPQHPFVVPQHRKLEAGDTIICEIHPKYAGYTTHIERTFSLGKPDPKRQAIYDGCINAYETGLARMGPGKCISEAVYAAGKSVEDRGLKLCELGIHGHGLGSLEHPRFRLHGLKADQIAIKTIGDVFVPGMVFAFNIDLFDPNWNNGETGTVFAETILITETGARRMHSFDMKLQELPIA
jgi:Xaa-Pro dipeptidase